MRASSRKTRGTLTVCLAIGCAPVPGFGEGLFPAYEFKPVVKNADYLAYTKTLDQERTDPEALDGIPYPAFATIVTKVTPGGQAEKSGVRAGWIFASADGIPQWDHRLKHLSNSIGQPRRELIFFSPKGEKKIVTAGPGKIGFSNSISPPTGIVSPPERPAWSMGPPPPGRFPRVG